MSWRDHWQNESGDEKEKEEGWRDGRREKKKVEKCEVVARNGKMKKDGMRNAMAVGERM